MTFTLDKVVPWGRSFEEYAAMFALSKEDLERRFLDCGGGPASFNSTLTRLGGRIISADPIYRFDSIDIEKRIKETYERIMEQTWKNKEEFVWGAIPSIEALGRVRMDAMKAFLSDYASGIKEGRYVVCHLFPSRMENSRLLCVLISFFSIAISFQRIFIFNL
jgi:hypothetical protein